LLDDPTRRVVASIDAQMETLGREVFADYPDLEARFGQSSAESRTEMMRAFAKREKFISWWALSETRQAILPHC
jgi:hypothetical protein